MSTAVNADLEPRRVGAGRGWDWLVDAFGLFGQAPGTWIAIGVVYLIIIIAASLVPGGSILLTLFGPVFSAGLMLGCNSQASGAGVKIEHLFAGFSGGRLGPLVLLAVLYMAAMIAVMLLGLAVALLGFGLTIASFSSTGALIENVLPLLLVFLIVLALYIPVAMGLWLAPALIALRGVAAAPAFMLSLRACLINFVPFLLYGLICLLVAIVASIPLGLGWLVAAPVFFISIYTSYRDMFPMTTDFNATQPVRPVA